MNIYNFSISDTHNIPNGIVTGKKIASHIYNSSYIKSSVMNAAKFAMNILALIPSIQPQQIKTKPTNYNCSVVPTLHGADTHEWRKRLVLAAEHNIVISGNYCGGKAFDELLQLIDQRMQQVKTLKVVIISHPKSVKDQTSNKNHVFENKKLVKQLQKLYPDRFSYVESPDSYFGLKKITNHTKCTVIDYGKYFIQGSTGIKDAFNGTGIETQNKEEALQAKSIQQTGDLIDRIIAVNLREQDFVFNSDDESMAAGKKMYREALYLAYKWDQHQKTVSNYGHQLSANSWELDDGQAEHFPAFEDIPSQELPSISESEAQTALYQMLMQPVPESNTISTQVKTFDSCDQKISDVQVKLFFTGPENSVNPYEQQMIKRINKAKSHIIVDHMYFHPSSGLMNAMISAAKRGVKITVITAGVTENSPPGEKFFAPRNAYNYAYLIQNLPENVRDHVEVYEFNQKERGLHKKVLIVDDRIYSGSSNMGYKSLVLMGDHEMNFEAQSADLVKETMKIIEQDIQCSKKVAGPAKMNLNTRLHASVHSLGARVWG